MLKFFGKKRETGPPAPWLKWLLAAFVMFAVINSVHKNNKVHDAVQKAEQDLAPNKIVNFSEYKNIFLSSYAAEIRVRDTAPGHGQPAVCGQRVAIAYETYLADNRPLPDKARKDKPLSFRIGDGKVMPVFEQGIIGMKEGGQRSLLAPPNMAYGVKDFTRPDMPVNTSVRFDIDLLSVAPALSDPQSAPYRITIVRNGIGQPIQCGEPAKLNMIIWGLDGKKLFTSKEPVSFTPGKSEIFLGLEQGAIGLAKGGARTLIVPPAFQKTMDGNKPAVDFPFPKAQTVLVDIEAVP